MVYNVVMARPTKLTPERQEQIIAMLKAGNYIETACAYAGIDPGTFYNWMRRGESASSGRFFQFFNAVQKARAEAEARNVQVIQKASLDTWQASAWWLERSFPDRWGRRVQDVNHGGEVTINFKWGDADDED